MTVQQFDFVVDVTQALIWQYNDADKLQKIIENKQNFINENMSDFWSNWYRDVFDLRTANDFGLQVWATILGMKFELASEVPTLIFGFDGSGLLNFNNSVFYPSSVGILTTEQKRLILQLRYRQITSNATIDEIQRAVSRIIPDAIVLDRLDMSVVITYPTIPDSQLLYILDNYNVIPIPNSVSIERRFGYGTWIGYNHNNFNNINFGA